MAITVYRKTTMSGGSATDLHTVDGAALLASDLAFITLAGYVYVYHLDDANSTADNIPFIIAPTTNPGTKRWVLQGVNVPLIKLNNILLTATATELNNLVGVSAGIVSASKALVAGANKNLDTLVIADGGLKLGAGAGTAVTALALELNKLSGVTITAAELSLLHGVLATGSEINAACDGDTAKNNHVHNILPYGSVNGNTLVAVIAGSTYTFVQNVTGVTKFDSSVTKAFSYVIARMGVVRIMFDADYDALYTSPSHQIYIDGSPVAGTLTNTSGTKTYYLGVSTGQSIEIWAGFVAFYSGNGATTVNISIKAADPLSGVLTLGAQN